MADDHGHGSGHGASHDAGHGSGGHGSGQGADAHGGHGNNHGTGQGKTGRREPLIFALILGGILLVPVSLLFVLKLPPILAVLIVGILAIGLLMAPRIFQIEQYEKGVQFQFGKYQKTLEPGWHWYFPSVQQIEKVDMRTQVLDIEPQDVITAEKVSLHIDAVVYVRIADPKKSIIEVRDLHKAASELIHGELRARIGRLTMNQVIENTEALNHDLKKALEKVERAWGIHSVSVEITDITMPPELEESFLKQKEANQYKQKIETEAQARRDALNIITAATNAMNDKTMTYLYMETLKKVADGRASKILYPLELTHLASALSRHVSAKSGTGGTLDEEKLAQMLVAEYLKSQSQTPSQNGARTNGTTSTKTTSTTVDVQADLEKNKKSGTAA